MPTLEPRNDAAVRIDVDGIGGMIVLIKSHHDLEPS